MGGHPLNAPVVGMATTPRQAGATGWWASDGASSPRPTAGFYGSTGGTRLNQAGGGHATHPDGGGYWLVASNGAIFNYGNAGFHGSLGANQAHEAVVGMATPFGDGGYWLVARTGASYALEVPPRRSMGGPSAERPWGHGGAADLGRAGVVRWPDHCPADDVAVLVAACLPPPVAAVVR